MHLSHLLEDLEAWYLGFDYDQRIATLFRPDQNTPPGTLTVRQGPDDVATVAENQRDYRRSARSGTARRSRRRHA